MKKNINKVFVTGILVGIIVSTLSTISMLFNNVLILSGDVGIPNIIKWIAPDYYLFGLTGLYQVFNYTSGFYLAYVVNALVYGMIFLLIPLLINRKKR